LTVDNLKTEENKIFICKKDDKLVDVWKGLVKHNFHSVPVLLKNSSKYFGVLDLHDICKFVLNHFGKEELQTIEDFWKHVEKSNKLKNIAVDDVMKSPLTRENPFKPVSTGYSLHFALELMARETNLHRIPIISKERKLVNMLTQSRLVQFFHENKKILGNRLNKPISLLGTSTSGVISVKDTQLAIDAFTLMQTHDITAVAVLDSKGHLTGVISETDLKTISEDGSLFYKLHQDAKTFVKLVGAKSKKLVVAKFGDSFGEVIDKLSETHVHRAFVVNDENKPTGVIALKDIIADIMLR
jgi:CBS domain-containing protein